MKITFKNGSVINAPQSPCATRGLRAKYIKWLKYKDIHEKCENKP